MSCPQLNSNNIGLGLLFKTTLWRLSCFLSFIAKDGKDGNGLTHEKFGLTLSSFDAIPTKCTKKLIMGSAFFKYFIRYSPHSLSGIFFA